MKFRVRAPFVMLNSKFSIKLASLVILHQKVSPTTTDKDRCTSDFKVWSTSISPRLVFHCVPVVTANICFPSRAITLCDHRNHSLKFPVSLPSGKRRSRNYTHEGRGVSDDSKWKCTRSNLDWVECLWRIVSVMTVSPRQSCWIMLWSAYRGRGLFLVTHHSEPDVCTAWKMICFKSIKIFFH